MPPVVTRQQRKQRDNNNSRRHTTTTARRTTTTTNVDALLARVVAVRARFNPACARALARARGALPIISWANNNNEALAVAEAALREAARIEAEFQGALLSVFPLNKKEDQERLLEAAASSRAIGTLQQHPSGKTFAELADEAALLQLASATTVPLLLPADLLLLADDIREAELGCAMTMHLAAAVFAASAPASSASSADGDDNDDAV
jgi:hypothetical protein